MVLKEAIFRTPIEEWVGGWVGGLIEKKMGGWVIGSI